MSIKEFRLDAKAEGVHGLDGLWGPLVGDLLYDMSAKGRGRGNHATRVGTGARTQLSDRGRVMLFNGADDAWNCERAFSIGLRPFTVCAWVWLTGPPATTLPSPFSSGNVGAGEWMLRIVNAQNANAQGQFYGAAAAINALSPLGTFHATKDGWTHVAITRRGALGRLYQDGLLVASDATSASNLNTAAVFQIGSAGSGANYWWDGMIDDVRYYSRELSLGQLAHIHRTTQYTPYADIALGRIRRHGAVHTGHVRRAAA